MNRIWRNATVVSLIVTALTAVYAHFFYGHLKPFVWQQVFAVASVLVIAPSLALSGIAHFWNFADKYIIYRKSLGLLGFYLGLVHVGISLYRSGAVFDAIALESLRDVSVMIGYVAVVLFALMPLFSNPFTIRRIGSNAVRLALRYLGYAGFVFVLLHAAYLLWPHWVRWCESGTTMLLPPTLIAVVVGVLVLILRVFLFFATRRSSS